MTNEEAEFRATPEGIKLCEETLKECIDIVIQKSESEDLSANQKLSLLIETGVHMLASGIFATSSMADDSFNKELVAFKILDMSYGVAKAQIRDALSAPKTSIILQ